jgi:hypothetical protein
MAADPNDLVRVAAGSSTEVQLWHDVLRAAGIESRVVGDDLAAGLGRGDGGPGPAVRCESPAGPPSTLEDH